MENINISFEDNQASELVIRNGKAPEIHQVQQDYHEGSFKSIIEIIDNYINPEQIPTTKCLVKYDTIEGSIRLHVHYREQNQLTIKAQLIPNPVLDSLNINKPATPYKSLNELYMALKFKRMLFISAEVHNSVLDKLQNFSAKINKHVLGSNNNKGQSQQTNVIDIQGLQNLNFSIKTPIFKDTEPITIDIYVEIQEESGSIRVYLTCLDLPQIMEEVKNGFMDNMINNYLKAIPCIGQ